MKKQGNLRRARSLIFVITMFAGFNGISAADLINDVAGARSVSQQTITRLSADLTKKLRADLADESVIVKVNNAEKYQISDDGIEVKGSGICLLKDDNNQLPIKFEAKINAQSQIVGSIKYDFVQFETSEFAPSTDEEVLMKELMKKVSADYKTEQIVISINGFEAVETLNGRGFLGNGEIRIGEVEWKKIKFDVVLAADNRAAKITYDVRK